MKYIYKVIRGGSWDFDARLARSAFRDTLEPSDANATIGFRLIGGSGK